MPLIAFDMEIARPVPDDRDILRFRPGIACAAFIREGDMRPLVIFSPASSPDLFVPQTKALTQEGATRILDELIAADDRGDTIVTWNGAAFDFRLLADETGRHADCVRLARHSVDMMFQILCERGHPLALDSALSGMGLQSKIHEVTLPDGRMVGVDGGLAPVLWQAGEYEAVMTYCGGDVAGTLALAIACREKRRLTWISRAGRPNHLPLGGRWKTVEECLALPKPDTSWMTDPMRPEDAVAWMTASPTSPFTLPL
jgi:hypothetical protein